jgi:hypothetical protein
MTVFMVLGVLAQANGVLAACFFSAQKNST